MTKQTDLKVPAGISLPRSVIKTLDAAKGKLGRSAFALILIEEGLARRNITDA
jgi:hypothetical protein